MSNICKLDLPESVGVNRFMKRERATLVNNFKLTSGNQLHNASIFANYLAALGLNSEAINFLESYVNKFEYSEEAIDLWGYIGQSIILLAHLYRMRGDTNKAETQIKRIIENDFVSGNKTEDLAYFISEHEKEMVFASKETQKYASQIISQEILRFLYYYEMWIQLEEDEHAPKKSIVEKIIHDSYIELNKTILQ